MSVRSLLPLTALALLWLAMLLLGGELWHADRHILNLLYAGGRPGLAAAAALVTQMGGWALLTLFTALAASYLLLRRRVREALLLIAIVLGGRLMVDLQKYLTARLRPELDHLVEVHSLSFPSGHAANSMIVYLAIALLLAPRPLAIAAALLLSLVVGLSRIVLGVHWPSDVAGGWAFGLLWTLGLVRLVRQKGTPPRLRH
ncbi:MAG TPA: phosphatase PAP2 family protein [Allosphingosinicella sp.]|nr:phosphatase PAP2 family protein [Allosphingosinicella sp.]